MPKLPSKESKDTLTVEIRTELLEQIRKMATTNRVTLRQIVEFGLEAYIESMSKVKKLKVYY